MRLKTANAPASGMPHVPDFSMVTRVRLIIFTLVIKQEIYWGIQTYEDGTGQTAFLVYRSRDFPP